VDPTGDIFQEAGRKSLSWYKCLGKDQNIRNYDQKDLRCSLQQGEKTQDKKFFLAVQFIMHFPGEQDNKVSFS